MGWWHRARKSRRQPGHPGTKGGPATPGRNTLQESGSSCQAHQEGTVTHPRGAHQGASSGDGAPGSAASCRLAQEGSARIQTLGSVPQHTASCSSSPAAYQRLTINTVITGCDRTGRGGRKARGRQA